jgi:hypothetical protein
MGDRTMTILPHSCLRKSDGAAVGLVLVLLASSLAAPAPCRAQGTRDGGDVGAFARPRLLRRFDTNTDGRLNVAEKAAMRRAFGGIDVPMLPAPTLDYSRIILGVLGVNSLHFTHGVVPAERQCVKCKELTPRTPRTIRFYDGCRAVANPGHVFGFANRVGWWLSWVGNWCLSSESV